MEPIRFSILVTCYNQRDFIRAAIESALAQAHASKEIIVVDDGSRDGSAEVLAGYTDSIQLVTFSSNRGAIEARNEGVARARGEYLVFLDGDDLFMPWALDVYEKIITERKPAIIVSSHYWFEGDIPPLRKDDEPRFIQFAEYCSLMAKDRPLGLSASVLVVKREIFQNVGSWSPGIFHLDLVDVAMKLGYSGRTILVRAPFTVFYRLHSANSIHTVPPFLEMAHRLIDKVRAGEYPGGREHRFERYAWLGGVIVFWTKRALRQGLYEEALRLFASGSSMILAAMINRCTALIKGPRPVETLELGRS